jgi:CHAT domain-containing protein
MALRRCLVELISRFIGVLIAIALLWLGARLALSLTSPGETARLPCEAQNARIGSLVDRAPDPEAKLHADWVVLSACNTAAGNKPGAEALSGLALAFFYGGARALLVSHWSVDSDARTRLTTSTFDLMKRDPKVGRAEALRPAIVAYMYDKSSPLNAYSAFWGRFLSWAKGLGR